MLKLELQDRDYRIFADVGERDCLDRVDIHERHFPDVSYRRCGQKCQMYGEAGLVHCVKLTVAYAEGGGYRNRRIPTVYFLTEPGAEAVEFWCGEYPRRVLRTDLKAQTILHRIRCSHIRLKVEAACQVFSLSSDWLMEPDMWPDAPKDALPQQRRVLYHRFRDGRKPYTCQPDLGSRVHKPGTPAGLGLFYEADLSSMGRKSLRGKLAGYQAVLKHESFRSYWPDIGRDNIRILWVFQTALRLQSVAADFREFEVAEQFRYAVFDELKPETLLTEPVWFDRNSDPVSIMRGHGN
jgi:hypothetical protein